MKKSLLVGTSDFKRYIDDNGYFVDKSLFIKEILENKSAVLLITRPRRFGKTLNMTMLKYFFQNDIKDNLYLFKNLKINEYDDIMAHQGKYPVIYISFKDVKFNSWDFTIKSMQELIRDKYREYNFLLQSDKLDNYEKQYIENILNNKAEEYQYFNSLYKLTYFMHKHFNKNVILLIDEYDTPIHSAYLNGYYDEVVEFMRGFLGSALKDNEYLERAVITGILRVAKESIFSGLNNIDSNTIIDNNFENFFGFTEKDVEELLKHYKLEFDITQVKNWYNGYVFGDTVIYNPWSIINYANNHKVGFTSYWVNTSDNELIRDLISQSSGEVKKELEELLEGKYIEKIINKDITLKDIYKSEDNIWAFLLFNGYLKVKEKSLLMGNLLAKLTMPNLEVEYLYKNIILSWFSDSISTNKFNQMLKSLVNGDIEEFGKRFRDYTINSISYFDVSGMESEKVYHAFVLGMLVALSEEYKVKSNRESGYGRYDVMIVPRDKNKKGIIIEFKKYDEEDEKSIEEAARNAVTQIKKKNYRQELLDEGIEEIIEIGIAFKGKEVKVIEGS